MHEAAANIAAPIGFIVFFLLMPVKTTVRAPAAWPTNWPGLERHVTDTFASMLEFVFGRKP